MSEDLGEWQSDGKWQYCSPSHPACFGRAAGGENYCTCRPKGNECPGCLSAPVPEPGDYCQPCAREVIRELRETIATLRAGVPDALGGGE